MGFGGDDHEEEDASLRPDDDGFDPPRRGLPDPLDRLWLHPSELSHLAPPGAPRPRAMWTTTLVAGAAGAILTLTVLGAVGALGRPAAHVSEPPVVSTSSPIATARVIAVAVADSVVAVSARDRNGTRRGSGVCVRRTGEILTSDRLVGAASKVEVTTDGGAVRTAHVVGRDATTDLVLLAVDNGTPSSSAGTKPPATTGATTTAAIAQPAQFAVHAPRAGDPAWVVGAPSPGDSSPWLSSGLVASTDSVVAMTSGPTTSGLLETAAASSNGSSGGALVDTEGDVTGIVLAPVGDDRMTYAVPIATALAIADDLRTRGYAPHGALGIAGVDGTSGPTVKSIVAGGPAARAGVRVGDVIDAVDGHEVFSMDDVMAIVRHDAPGQRVELELERGTAAVETHATLAAMITP